MQMHILGFSDTRSDDNWDPVFISAVETSR